MAATFRWNRERLRLRLKEMQRANPNSGPPQSDLRALLHTAAAPGEDLAWLASHDLDPEVSAAAFVALFYALRGDGVGSRLRAKVREHAQPVLLRALQSSLIPDSRKYSIGPLYSLCAGDVPGQDYRAFFKDFDKVTSQMIRQAVEGLNEEPRSVDRVLMGMETLLERDLPLGSRFAAALELAEHMQEEKPAAAAMLCGSALLMGWLEENVRDHRVDGALRLICNTHCPQAAWILQEIGRWPGTTALSQKARRCAQKLELQGVRAACTVNARFSHGVITAPDGLGTRQLALFYDPGGRKAAVDKGSDVLMLLFNERTGLKDSMCVFGEGRDVEAQLRRRSRDLAMAPCSLGLAREFMGDALACHKEKGTAPPASFIIYRPYLGGAPIIAARHRANLSKYDLRQLLPSPDLVADSARLASSPSYGMFMFTSDRAYAYFREKTRKNGSAALGASSLDVFLREVAIEERDTLLKRLAATLEVESLAGRAQRKINQTAAHTWLGMMGNVLPFHEVPYVQAIGRLSAQMITENLTMGFRTQAEVNEAAQLAEQQSETQD